jgi:hypothetical protein
VRPVFVDMLGALLAPGVRVPDELLEIRNMLATRAEAWERKARPRVGRLISVRFNA